MHTMEMKWCQVIYTVKDKRVSVYLSLKLALKLKKRNKKIEVYELV